MSEQTISLGEREDKPLVRIMIVIFGLLCIFTAGWWTVFLVKYPDNEKIFWAGSIFLFLFGIFQVYSGLGYAKRYVKRENGNITLRQNSLLPAKKVSSDQIRQLEIRSYDMVLHRNDLPRIRIKLGLRYPDLGQKVRDFIIDYAEENNIEIFYKNEAL
ncbi:MAG TPA: hypothetical protein ENH59_08140 [Bacteroidetes bacterium]|nr:hypothetical protein [Bacteroidota bacterium]